jgi:hypothetical protein
MSYPITDTQSDCWVTNMWHYLSSLDGTTISTSMKLPLQRERDTALMKQVSKSYKGIMLQRINAIRLFLQVFFLSDITTSYGKQISTKYRYSNKLCRRTSILHWPIQAEPGNLAWTEWRIMLKQYHTHRDFTLRIPLGCWLDATPTQTWHILVHPPTETTIYIKHNNLWHLYRPTTCSRTSVFFITTIQEPPPTDMLPITTDPTTNHRHQLQIYTYSKREDTIIFQQPPGTSFPQFLRNLSTHERWVIGHVLPQSPTDMNNFLVIGEIGLSSDGSVKGLSTTYSIVWNYLLYILIPLLHFYHGSIG